MKREIPYAIIETFSPLHDVEIREFALERSRKLDTVKVRSMLGVWQKPEKFHLAVKCYSLTLLENVTLIHEFFRKQMSVETKTELEEWLK